MKLSISREGELIITKKDFSDVEDIAEVAQFMVELELIKLDLLEMYDGMRK